MSEITSCHEIPLSWGCYSKDISLSWSVIPWKKALLRFLPLCLLHSFSQQDLLSTFSAPGPMPDTGETGEWHGLHPKGPQELSVSNKFCALKMLYQECFLEVMQQQLSKIKKFILWYLHHEQRDKNGLKATRSSCRTQKLEYTVWQGFVCASPSERSPRSSRPTHIAALAAFPQAHKALFAGLLW